MKQRALGIMRRRLTALLVVIAALVAALAACGGPPGPLFRFPHGDADARTIGIANQAGYAPVRWTVDTLGWEGPAGHIRTAIIATRCWPRCGRVRSC